MPVNVSVCKGCLSRKLFKSSAIQLHNFQNEPFLKSLHLIPISSGLKLYLVEYQVWCFANCSVKIIPRAFKFKLR